jgi:hypothetical protein
MTFSIIKELDIDKLYRTIEKYCIAKETTTPYLFMNQETIDKLPTESSKPFYYLNTATSTMGYIGQFCGCKVFRDNSLRYGEVEIR